MEQLILAPEPEPKPDAKAGQSRAKPPVGRCEWCARAIPDKRSDARFCDDVCRNRARHAKQEELGERREMAARAGGQAKARERHSEQAGAAADVMVRYLAKHGTAIVSDVRAECERLGIRLQWGKNWVGGMLQKHDWFEATGEVRRAYHEGSRGRMVRVYRLSAEGRRVLEEMRR